MADLFKSIGQVMDEALQRAAERMQVNTKQPRANREMAKGGYNTWDKTMGKLPISRKKKGIGQ